MSGTALSSYSSIVTDIQSGGVFATTSAYVNGGVNAASGPYQYQSFAVVEFDPNNATIFPGTAVATPTNLSLSLYNNPTGFNSNSGAAGNLATGVFDVYLLPTYTAPTSLVYQTTVTPGFPLGLQAQGGLSTATASNFYLGSITAPTTNGLVNVNLALPTGGGTLNAATVLTNDLSKNTAFEIAIVPDTTTSSAQFQGEVNYYNNSPNPNTGNGVGVDGELDETPQLSLTVNQVAETLSMPFTAVSVNQNNVSNVVEIDVARTGYAGDSATVNYTTADGTGLAGTDYGNAGSATPLTGSLTFAPYQTEGVITIPTIDTGGAPDVNFTVSLSGPTATFANTSLGTHTATVTIIGATNEADNIGGLTTNIGATDYGSNGFVLSTSGTNIQVGGVAAGTFIPVNGAVTNGANDPFDTAVDNFDTQAYEVINFNASAAQSALNVNSLTSLTLELDNYDSQEGYFLDGTPFTSPNPVHTGNFNIYLLEGTATSVATNATSSFHFLGSDPNDGGIVSQGIPVLLGTASYSDQPTQRSPISPLGFPEGVQDTYTLDLSAAAATFLKNQLNATGTSFTPIRLAITPGSSGFAADFANNNSSTGGNYGIQPYLWFSGSASTISVPPEAFAINYSSISVNANESQVEVDITRPSTGFTADTATVNFVLGNGTAVLGTDYNAPATESVTFAAGQSVATATIPLIPDTTLTAEKTFTITITGASTGGSEGQPTYSTAPTTITLVPPVTPSKTAVSDFNTALETTGTFSSYAYLNGSVFNGTGSFAFQGFQMIEFQASQFVSPGQQLSSLTDISLSLSNYENTPGANYSGLPGDFTLYLAADPETTTEISALTNDKAIYNANTDDGIGGFTGGTGNLAGVGPLSASTAIDIDPAGTLTSTPVDYAIPIGVVSFNSKLGADYFTPTQEALNQPWYIPNLAPGGTLGATQTGGTFTALQLMQNMINSGENVRILAAPGNSAFRAYFYGAYNTGGSGGGGPSAPQLLVQDTVVSTQTEEAVGFSSSSYAVNDNGTSVSVPVLRTDLVGSGGLNDTLTVSYTTADGNALAGSNYYTTSGTLTFGPGVSAQTITVPIIATPNQVGATAFTIKLSAPATSDTAHTLYVAPVLTANSTATVFITDNANNAETLTQYTSSVGDVGTAGPVTFGGSALNPAPPFNFSDFSGNGHYTALDFNDSSVSNYNDPAEFNGPTGPLTPTGPSNSAGPTYTPPANEPSGTGPVTFNPTGDGSYYTSTIDALNEISLGFVNYYQSSPGMLLDVILVSDASSNILPGAQGTSKNPHFYDATIHNITSGVGDGVGLGTANFQFGTGYLLGTITNPAVVNANGYTVVPLTSFSSAAQAALISDLNTGTKFRILVAPESSNTSLNADWIYGYTVANPGYSADTGFPINYYIQPDLSFDVSYASNNTALPSNITASANADYLWDPTTDNLTVTNGTLSFTSATNLPVNLTVTGPTASANIVSGQSIAGLTVSNGATVTVTSLASTGGVLTIGSSSSPAVFSIDSTSKLDLTTNTLVIDYGSGSDPYSTIQSQILSGYNSGSWTGLGITSSSVAAANASGGLYGLGSADGADGIVSGLSAGQIEIMPTLLGDATLLGTVNFGDFQLLAASFGSTGTWDQGNFAYGSTVNFGDFQLLAANFGKTSAFGGGLADYGLANAPAAARAVAANVFSDVPLSISPASSAAADSIDDLLQSADSASLATAGLVL